MERVSINNYVVRFFSSAKEAANTAKALGLNVYQKELSSNLIKL